MSKIVWDQTGQKAFETGVSQGVLYPQVAGAYPLGVAWNGLTAISESPSGAEASPFYADNIKYANIMSAEEFAATIEAYMYPDEFAVCNGEASVATGVTIGQQTRTAFGLCYRTEMGNDTDATLGYKLHLIYGGLAAPSEKGYQTINDSPELVSMSWEVSTTPVAVAGHKPTATLVVDSTKVAADKMAELEKIIYGVDATVEPVVAAVVARLPLPSEVIALIGVAG